jgi:hypothetical protein
LLPEARPEPQPLPEASVVLPPLVVPLRLQRPQLVAHLREGDCTLLYMTAKLVIDTDVKIIQWLFIFVLIP